MPPIERSGRATTERTPGEGRWRRNLERVANGAVALGSAAAILGGGTAAVLVGDTSQPERNDWKPLLSNHQVDLAHRADVLENLVWNPGLQQPLTSAADRGAARAASQSPTHLELGSYEHDRGKHFSPDVYEAVAEPGASTLYILKNGSAVDGFQVQVPSEAGIREIADGQLQTRAFREGLVRDGALTAELGGGLFAAGALARRRLRRGEG